MSAPPWACAATEAAREGIRRWCCSATTSPPSSRPCARGETVYDNIRKVVAWTLPTNGGEAAVLILAILFGFALPMTPTQILWINMVMTVSLGLVLAFEPPEPGLMERPPRRRDAPCSRPSCCGG